MIAVGSVNKRTAASETVLNQGGVVVSVDSLTGCDNLGAGDTPSQIAARIRRCGITLKAVVR